MIGHYELSSFEIRRRGPPTNDPPRAVPHAAQVAGQRPEPGGKRTGITKRSEPLEGSVEGFLREVLCILRVPSPDHRRRRSNDGPMPRRHLYLPAATSTANSASVRLSYSIRTILMVAGGQVGHDRRYYRDAETGHRVTPRLLS